LMEDGPTTDAGLDGGSRAALLPPQAPSSDHSMPPPRPPSSASTSLRRQVVRPSRQVAKTTLERETSGYLRERDVLVNRHVGGAPGTLNDYEKVVGAEGDLGHGNEAKGVRKYKKRDTFFAVKTFDGARQGSKRSGQGTLSLRPDHAEREDILREAAIMVGLNHRNIVHIVEVIDDSRSDTNQESEKDKMHIVMEFVEGGSLHQRLNETAPVKEADLHMWFMGAVLGLQYLHNQDVLHLDLKPENLLLCNRSAGAVKICDFGTSTFSREVNKAKRGTPLFRPPELSRGAGLPQDREAGKAADVWSLGATFFMVAFWLRPIPTLEKMFEWLHVDPVKLPEVSLAAEGCEEDHHEWGALHSFCDSEHEHFGRGSASTPGDSVTRWGHLGGQHSGPFIRNTLPCPSWPMCSACREACSLRNTDVGTGTRGRGDCTRRSRYK